MVVGDTPNVWGSSLVTAGSSRGNDAPLELLIDNRGDRFVPNSSGYGSTSQLPFPWLINGGGILATYDSWEPILQVTWLEHNPLENWVVFHPLLENPQPTRGMMILPSSDPFRTKWEPILQVFGDKLLIMSIL